jgi:hypothetical protein
VPPPEKLPPWLEEKIAKQMREGISLSIRWRLPTDDPDHGEVAAIYWRPGDPNALADIILKYVYDKPVPLRLGGQKFMIHRQEDWPEGWDENT